MEGQREINELHVPLGRPVKLTMTSEDVIHSFFVPAFRIKPDVVPGRYSTMWFEPTKPGKYHLFCAEYCGTKHSGMIGWIYVMEPQDYQNWLSGGGSMGTLAENGEKLFHELACTNCHKPDGTGRCPPLVGLFGKTVQLAGGGTVKVDEAYIRESILQPSAKVAAGYQPIMPTFQGLVTEEGVLQLVEYIKSIGPKPAAGRRSGGAPAQCPLREIVRHMITAAAQEREHYLNASYGIKSWLLTKDHKRIGLLYLATITLFFFLGGAFATLIRVELLTPAGRPGLVRDLQQAVHHARRGDGVLLPDSRRFPRRWAISSCR